MEPRLKSRIRVQALIRRCDLAAIAAAVIGRGDADAGAILLKFSTHDGATVLSQSRQADGAAVWLRATGAGPVADTEAEAYIERQRRRDPDLWVVEIEADAGNAAADLLDAPIVS